LLPKGFPFDEGYEWLRAVGFGEEERSKSEEYRRKQSAAAELGFADEEALKYAQWFASLDPETRRGMKESFESQRKTELPENVPSNPDQRAARVGAQATEAPERRSEVRLRAVSVNREGVKEETKQYLRHLYTNPDGEMICQICKTVLPFKLDDGSYYVEHVEFLSVKNNSKGLKKHYYQNYLALCPNHSAMFQYANGAPELMKEMFAELEEDEVELEVLLAQENATIYFTKTHIADLKKVIQVDASAGEDKGDGEEENENVPLEGIA
jgi:DNA-directed RNA polymerase subunit F